MKKITLFIALLLVLATTAQIVRSYVEAEDYYETEPYTIRLQASAETATINDKIELTAYVTDKNGNPVAGYPVIFSSIFLQGAFLSLTSDSIGSSAMTDNAGMARGIWYATKDGRGFLRAEITTQGYKRYGLAGIIIKTPDITVQDTYAERVKQVQVKEEAVSIQEAVPVSSSGQAMPGMGYIGPAETEEQAISTDMTDSPTEEIILETQQAPEMRKIITPPPFPEDKEITITLSRGWNLVSLPSPLVKFISSSDKQKLISFVWIAEKNEYMSLQNARDYLGSRFESSLAEQAFWIYSYDSSSLQVMVTGKEQTAKLMPGWNLMSIHAGYYGWILSELANGCKLQSAYRWNSDSQSWDNVGTSYQITSRDLGKGMVVKSQNACALVVGGYEPIITPPDYPIECSTSGAYCAGISNRQCCGGYTCKMDGNYPDAGGICVTDRACSVDGDSCGAGGMICCAGYTCTWEKYAQVGYCKKSTCAGEGESIPVVPNAPSCCAGLTLIPPKENVVGSQGICTAKCGNGICDTTTESARNCPKDCSQTTTTCKDSDGGIDYAKYGVAVDTKNGISYPDTCIDNNKLTEYYCSGTAVQKTQTTCANGCSNGACTAQPQITASPLRINTVTTISIDKNFPFMKGYVLVERGMAEAGWYGDRLGQLNLETGEVLSRGNGHYPDPAYQFSKDDSSFQQKYYNTYGKEPNHIGIAVSGSGSGAFTFDAFTVSLDGINVYLPAFKGDASGYWIYFYVASDGSTYYANNNHKTGYPDMSYKEAFQTKHLARKAGKPDIVPAQCTDSDGRDYLTFGYVQLLQNGNGQSIPDSCEKSGQVVEMICENGKEQKVWYPCQNFGSNYVCEAGRCVASSYGANECSDSDGLDYATQGTVSGRSGASTYSFTDNCLDTDRLAEYTCSGVAPHANYKSCASLGKTCSNGACIASNNGGASPLLIKEGYNEQEAGI
ncbi:MAG: Ig-like domain-containing protein [Nanoarchaeota archaeon]